MKKSMKLMVSMMMLLSTSMTFVACSSDDATPIIPSTTLSIEVPANLSNVEASNMSVTLTNVETQKAQTITGGFLAEGQNIVATVADMEEGNYNVTAKGHLTFTTANGVKGEQDFELSQQNVAITTAAPTLKMVVNTFKADGGFVISEIFVAGTKYPDQNRNYMYDAYFKITNNSDMTLYADSLAIMESAYVSSAANKHDWTPDVRPTDFPAGTLFMIPGNGTEHPVAPGQSIVIANNGMDHTTVNSASIDLSKADFEVYLDNGGNSMDTDYDVPNMVYYYSYTATIWIPSIQMNRSYAIARMHEDPETFIQNHSLVPTYTATNGRVMKSNQVQVPNSWILDAVNLGQADDFDWFVISEALDAGFAAGRQNSGDTGQVGTSVIRKQDANGKYVDTNNSTNDFLTRQTPSLKK